MSTYPIGAKPLSSGYGKNIYKAHFVPNMTYGNLIDNVYGMCVMGIKFIKGGGHANQYRN